MGFTEWASQNGLHRREVRREGREGRKSSRRGRKETETSKAKKVNRHSARLQQLAAEMAGVEGAGTRPG